MVERDYAAPLNQERRDSIWAKLTSGVRLSRKLDWDSAPPLTPALREQFPDLEDSRPTIDDAPPVPSIPDALRSDYYASRPSGQRHSRSDSAQGDNNRARDAQAVSRNDGYSQQFGSHRLSRPLRLQSAGHEQIQGRQNTEQVAATVHKAPVQSQSPLRFAESYQDSRSVPTPSAHFSSPPSYSQHDTDNAIYQRDSQGYLFAVSNTSRCRTQEQTIRRRPAVQSSLRNQVSGEHGGRSGDDSRNHGITSATSSNHRNTATAHGGYSHYPLFSPSPSTEPHALPQRSRSSSAARLALATHPDAAASLRSPRSRIHNPSHRTVRELQASASGPTSSSLSLLELQELEGSLRYDPPGTPNNPLPNPPFIQQHHQGSSSSIATFENPNPSSQPLSRIQAQLAGLKQALQSPQSLKASAIKLAKQIKPKSKELWNRSVAWKEKTRTRIDVASFGPQVGCMCSVCVRKRGMDPMRATEVAHYVPDITRPLSEAKLHESGYGRLAHWEF